MSAVIDPAQAPESVLGHMSKLLDLKLDSESDTVRVITSGLTARTYKRVARRLKFPATLVAPESTVRRRLSSKGRFTEAESERVVRLARVYAEAVQLFGDEDAALDWFKTPARYLSGGPDITPMALSATDAGARLIESHIRRTAHGIF